MSDTTTPTQVRHPWRATVRTAVELAPMAAAGVGAIVDVVREVRPDWIVGWGPAATAASLIITRILADPRVDALLTRIGWGAAPKHAAE